MKRSPCWVVGVLALVAGCGSQPLSIDGSGDAIINGTVDTTHTSVVAVFNTTTGCTGAFIGERKVVTAAHCIADTSAGDWAVAVGDDYNNVDVVYDVAAISMDPTYDSNTLLGDVGLLTLSTDPALTPMEVNTDPNALTAGLQFTVVGYGLVSSPNGQNSLRRSTTQTIQTVTSAQFGVNTATSGPCRGDSGAPALVNDVIIGFASYGDQNCNQASVYERADTHLDYFDIAGPTPTPTASPTPTSNPTPTPTPGGDNADDDGPSGCACRLAADHGGAPTLFTALLALASAVLLWRRRAIRG